MIRKEKLKDVLRKAKEASLRLKGDVIIFQHETEFYYTSASVFFSSVGKIPKIVVYIAHNEEKSTIQVCGGKHGYTNF